MGQSVRVDTSKNTNDAVKNIDQLERRLKEAESMLTECRQKLAKNDEDCREQQGEHTRLTKLATNTKVDVEVCLCS